MELTIAGVIGQVLALTALALLRWDASDGLQALRSRTDSRQEPVRSPIHDVPGHALAVILMFFAAATAVALAGGAARV